MNPCWRHHVLDCDIQRCAEERLGDRSRRVRDDGDYVRARAELAAMRRARRQVQAARAERDAEYRQVAARQPTPTGHSNRHGGSISRNDGNGR